MDSKYIFKNQGKEKPKYLKKLELLRNINTNNIKSLDNLQSHKHKKTNIKLENMASQECISENDYEFVCEYVEFLVCEPDKKKPL